MFFFLISKIMSKFAFFVNSLDYLKKKWESVDTFVEFVSIK